MSLREMQATFYGAISKPPGNKAEIFAIELIKKAGQLSPLQRLDIYRNTGLASKIKALQQIYPICKSILGEQAFSNLAYQYAIDNPSFSNDLNIYGEIFSTFIYDVVQENTELNEFVYLSDLCRLEWFWHKVYYQDNDSLFDVEAFTRHSHKAENINLNISNSLEVLASNYPVHLIWQQHRHQQAQSLVKGLDEAEYLCIYRQDFIARIEKISKPQFELINACRQGQTLEELALDEMLSKAMQTLPEMIKQGWICGFTHHAGKMSDHA